MPHTHYDNLKVSRDAPIEVIRASFLALSAKYDAETHPDPYEAERVLRVINRAYAALSDPVKRAEHDRWIAEQESRKETPPAPPPPPAPDGRRSWTGWIGPGIVLAALACIVVAMVLGPHLPQISVTSDSSQMPITPVFKTDKPPSDLRAPIIVSSAIPKAEKNPYQDDPSPKPSERTPGSITQYRFVQAPSGGQPSRRDIGGERKVQPDAPFPPRYSRPPLSPTGQPWPSSSEYLLKQPEDGNSEVTIDNMQTGSDMLVELFDLSNRPPTAVRVVFLRAREQFHMNGARSGSYDIRYMNLDTGVIRKSEPLRLTERKLEHDVPKANGTEHITDIEGTEFSLTLYTVPMGNTHSQVINREEFDSTFLPRLGR